MIGTWSWRGALFAFLTLVASVSQAATCSDQLIEDASYTICEVDLTQEKLTLFLYDENGLPFGYFGEVDLALEASNQRLGFATNAGMYHPDRAPVGLYIEDGHQIQGLIKSASSGNFGLLPNGVLCLIEDQAYVIETLKFAKDAPDCRSATQSGPMLVIDGALHPKFLAQSTSRYIRNGVGTSEDGLLAYFVISNEVVNFHSFASVFKDTLGLQNALYFDGNVSRLRAPNLDRDDLGFGPLGPMIGVVEPLE